MPARSAIVALGAAQLYLVDAPAGLAASALKCGPLSNCLIAPRVGQVCRLLPARVPLLSSSPTPSFGVPQSLLLRPSSLLSTAPAGLAASALNCGPLSDCLIAPRVGQVCLLRGLPGHTLPSNYSVLTRVCASIQTYSPLHKHCCVSPEVFFASKYNEMRAGQYASGLSARTGTTKSTIKH